MKSLLSRNAFIEVFKGKSPFIPLRRSLAAVAFLGMIVSSVFAGVIYEFEEEGTGDILGEIEFNDTVASATSPWSTTDPGSLVDFFFDFGTGTVTEMDFTTIFTFGFGSIDGSELDDVALQNGLFTFLTNGDPLLLTLDRTDILPTIVDAVQFNTLQFTGQWKVKNSPSSPVPEPSTIALLGIGLSALIICQKRKKRKGC